MRKTTRTLLRTALQALRAARMFLEIDCGYKPHHKEPGIHGPSDALKLVLEADKAIETGELPEVDMREVVCSQCHHPFRLVWQDYTKTPVTLIIRAGQVLVRCPRHACQHEESLEA